MTGRDGVRFSPEEMLARLVAFDTTSHLPNNPLIEFVSDYLAGWGVPHRVIPGDEPGKSCLYATIGPKEIGGYALSGHTDVVPVTDQAWDTDPFTLTRLNGRLYGRGTTDMKGFVAVCLALVPDLLARRLNVPIHIALSYDEEVGCVGVRPMLAHIREHLPLPRAVIVGEPTNMEAIDAHKDIQRWVTEVTGREAHSAMTHLGVNAAMIGAELAAEISKMAAERRARGDPSGRFDPPFTTINIGRLIGAGPALNILPRNCTIHWEIRALPDDDTSDVVARVRALSEARLAEMRVVASSAAIETRLERSAPGLRPDPGSAAEQVVFRLLETNRAGAVSYLTEAGLFQDAGMPAVVCGPGDIAQAHQPNEFIEVDQLQACARFVLRLADHAASA